MIYFIQANLYLILLTICYRIIFRKLKHFRFGRPFLLLGIVLSLLLPLIEVQQIRSSIGSSMSYTHVQDVINLNATNSIQTSFNIYTIIGWVYCLGVFFFLSKLLYSLASIYLLRYNSIRKENYYELANSSAAFSFFKWIFIGSEVPHDNRKILYQHEEIHSKSYHSIDLVFFHLIQVLFWFNPIVYTLRRYITELHEFEADQKSAENKSLYIELIINHQFKTHNLQIIHQFNSYFLKNRIMRIKENQKTKIQLKSVIVTIFLFAALFTFNQNLNSQNQFKAGNKIESSNSTYVSSVLSKISDISIASGSAVFLAEEKHYKNAPDDLPSYQGGYEELSKFIKKHLKYNTKVKENEIEGMVYIEFIVEKDGSIKNPRIAKGINKELNKNALRIIKQMPKWIPAKKDNIGVAAKVLLPIRYSIDGKIHKDENKQVRHKDAERYEDELPREHSEEYLKSEERREFEKYLKNKGYKKIEKK